MWATNFLRRALRPSRLRAQSAFVIANLVMLVTLTSASCAQVQAESAGGVARHPERSGIRDFDFIVGRWLVHHRQLRQRLAGSNSWTEFEGSLVSQKLLGGSAVIDDNLLNGPADPYHAVNIRAYDEKSQLWSTWWLDGRTPAASLEPAVRGKFKDGVGLFYADDTFKGRRIRVRYIYSNITSKSCHWEQAYSADGGRTWEVNWVMDFKRIE